ncbi:hypothetical protein HY522_10260 [bacterium]|nr:hypothetical protein [bacterium]
MKDKWFGFSGWMLIGLAMLAGQGAAVAAAAEKKAPEMKVPAEARGFVGILTGKVVSTDVQEGSWVLKVDDAKAQAGSKAKKPAKLKGQKVQILPRMVLIAGKLVVDEEQVRLIKELKAGAKIVVDVKSDGLYRLRMQELPKSTASSGK